VNKKGIFFVERFAERSGLLRILRFFYRIVQNEQVNSFSPHSLFDAFSVT
jgi:hypothetical protein